MNIPLRTYFENKVELCEKIIDVVKIFIDPNKTYKIFYTYYT